MVRTHGGVVWKRNRSRDLGQFVVDASNHESDDLLIGPVDQSERTRRLDTRRSVPHLGADEPIFGARVRLQLADPEPSLS